MKSTVGFSLLLLPPPTTESVFPKGHPFHWILSIANSLSRLISIFLKCFHQSRAERCGLSPLFWPSVPAHLADPYLFSGCCHVTPISKFLDQFQPYRRELESYINTREPQPTWGNNDQWEIRSQFYAVSCCFVSKSHSVYQAWPSDTCFTAQVLPSPPCPPNLSDTSSQGPEFYLFSSIPHRERNPDLGSSTETGALL